MTQSVAPELGAPDRAPPEDPWERWGWVYATIWLFFLAFPLVGAFERDGPGWQLVLLVGAIAAFAGVYAAGWILTVRRPAGTQRRTPVVVLVLLGIWAAVIVPLGPSALGMLIFIVIFALLLGSTRVAVAAVAVVVVLAVSAAVAFRAVESAFVLGVISVMIVIGGLLRVMEQRREVWRATQEQLSLVAERERVARDVHDVLGHSLTVITTKAELAERLHGRDPERVLAELRSIQSLGREALTEVRATVAGLRVARLTDELDGAAQALAAAAIAADVPQDPQLVDPRRRLVLAWVLREAVTNVVRHSGARRCTVELGRHSLVVCDDGRGRGQAPPGNGLRGVEERVRAAGGTLTLSDAHPGTRLEVSWA